MPHGQPGKTNRRQFIGFAGASALSLLTARKANALFPKASHGEFLFLEAEGFTDFGGWEIDQQSMDQMGSPYLLAHGLGVPVRDAMAKVRFPSAGTYRVWVRTRDWVAPWNAPGAPGAFQLLIDGKPLDETFGTKNAKWHWHDGGTVEVGEEASVALHDLTGFEGRCEAVLFCKDPDFKPVHDVAALTKFRRRLLGLPDEPEEGGLHRRQARVAPPDGRHGARRGAFSRKPPVPRCRVSLLMAHRPALPERGLQARA